MKNKFWSLDRLIEEEDFKFEYLLNKDPNNIDIWNQYYAHRVKSKSKINNFYGRIFVLERGIRIFKRNFDFWKKYLELFLINNDKLNENHDEKRIKFIIQIFERATLVIKDKKWIWVEYLKFLFTKTLKNDKYINKKIKESLFYLDKNEHYGIWEICLRSNKVIKNFHLQFFQFLSFNDKNYFILDNSYNQENKLDYFSKYKILLTKLFEIEDYDYALQIVKNIIEQRYYDETFNFDLNDYFYFFIELLGKKKITNLNFQIFNTILEDLAVSVFLASSEEVGTFFAKMACYFDQVNFYYKARSYFCEGLNKVSSVENFIFIYDSFMTFEESNLSKVLKEFELKTDDQNLSLDIDYKLYCFENLLNNHLFLLNDLMIHKNKNNLDNWFDRIELFKNDVQNKLKTYVDSLSKINPFNAYSLNKIKENTITKLWIDYANVYVENNDYKTADLIYSKSVASKFKYPDDLTEIYINWSKMLLLWDLSKKSSISLIESVLFKKKITDAELMSIDYKNSKLSIYLRLQKSYKLWIYYLELLCLNIINELETEKIDKVINTYNTMIELKIAKVSTILEFALFLQKYNMIEKSLIVYERGLKLFKIGKLRFEIWNHYLGKVFYLKISKERIRDLLTTCFDEYKYLESETYDILFLKSLLILYARFEMENKFILSMIEILKKSLKLYSDFLNKKNDDISFKKKVLDHKFSIYLFYLKVLNILGEYHELRLTFETILQDPQLSLSQIIEMCLDYVNFELHLNEIERVRMIFKYVCGLLNPKYNKIKTLWERWEDFELNYGNETMYKQMLRYKRDLTNSLHYDLNLDCPSKIEFIKSNTNE